MVPWSCILFSLTLSSLISLKLTFFFYLGDSQRRTILAPSRDFYLTVLGDVFSYHSWGRAAAFICYVEARGAAKHPTVHKTAPTTKNYVVLKLRNPRLDDH